MPKGIYPRSEKTKRILSLAHMGKKLSEEHKKNISDTNKEKKRSKESKKRMCIAQRKNRFIMSKIAKEKGFGKWMKGRGGSQSCLWKGGKYKDGNGYIWIYMPNHPFANVRKYVKRANLVMEKHLGRPLIFPELIHHKGIHFPIGSIENRQDDTIENLQLFTNVSEHMKFHHHIKRNSHL